jgi:hypothetical protein
MRKKTPPLLPMWSGDIQPTVRFTLCLTQSRVLYDLKSQAQHSTRFQHAPINQTSTSAPRSVTACAATFADGMRTMENCPKAEFEIGPYVPLAAVPRSRGYSFLGPKNLSKSNRVSRNKRASVRKHVGIDRPLSRRGSLSAPEFYPDDN